MGKRKRSTAVRSETAKKAFRAYWAQQKKTKDRDVATPSTSREAEAAAEPRPPPTTPTPAASTAALSATLSADALSDTQSAAAYRDKLLSGKLSSGESGCDDDALVVISVGRLKQLLSGHHSPP